MIIIFVTISGPTSNYFVQKFEQGRDAVNNNNDNYFQRDRPEAAYEDESITTNLNSYTRSIQPEPINSDWKIDTGMTISNANYIMRGNLTVTSTGKLSLINTTIIFDSDENNTYGIFIEPGGELITGDLDYDFSTQDDFTVVGTNMSKGNMKSTFIFHAQKNSTLNLQYTTIHFGNGNELDDQQSGISIETDHSRISRCIIENSSTGIISKNNDDSFIENVMFNNMSKSDMIYNNATNGHIRNLNLSNPKTALQIENSRAFYINQTEFHSNNYAIEITDSSDVFLNNVRIENSSSISIDLINSTGISLIDTEVSNSSFAVKSIYSSVSIINCTFTDNTDGLDFNNSTINFENISLLRNSRLYYHDHSIMNKWGIEPFFWQSTEFLNNTIKDIQSETHVFTEIVITFAGPGKIAFPDKGNVTIFDSERTLIYSNPIAVGPHIIPLELIWDETGFTFPDPLTVKFDYNGYYLNQTFSILTSKYFNFKIEHNNPPELKNGKVTPDRGDSSMSFVFYVEYADADGNEPLYVNLNLANLTYGMERILDGGTPLTGIKYQLEFFKLASGHHEYFFVTDDGRNVTNSITVLKPGTRIDVKARDSPDSEEGEDDFMFILLGICFTMVFIFVIFVIALNYFMQKKLKEAGGVPPGTLPEDLGETQTKETLLCSECGAEIDAGSESCPKCGEVFEGEEFQCPKCEKIVPDDASSCPYCGNKFLTLKEEEQKKDVDGNKFDEKFDCSECGAVVGKDMDKCPGCGEPFDTEVTDMDEDIEDGQKTITTIRKTGKPRKGKTKEEELTFICSVCGASVKESANKCPKCKTEFV
jgi:ribosomal protein L40E